MPKQINIVKTERQGRMNIVYYREPGAPGDHAHHFPDEALEWRVAEFDYDPSDTATLVETILAERWEEDEDPRRGLTIAKQAMSQRASDKRARIAAVGLTIANKQGPEWADLLSKVPAPAAEKIEMRRQQFDQVRRGLMQ